jgi:hypothetical protein
MKKNQALKSLRPVVLRELQINRGERENRTEMID